MSTRLRQRATVQGMAGPSSTSLPLRPSHRRATRHASILNYAELSESDEEEAEEDDDEDELHGEHQQDEEDDDSDELPTDSDSDGGDGEPGDRNFVFRQRASKRPHPSDASSAGNRPSKRRRQPQRRATAEFLVGDDIYLSPSSDGASRTRRKSQASATAGPTAAAASTTSPQTRRQRDNRRQTPPTKQNKHVIIDMDDKQLGVGRRDGVRTPTSKRAVSPPRTNRPPWATLPYLILSNIFSYGAAPLDNIASVRWLLAISRTCRAFAEPALRALYESPPMLTMNMAHNLVDHLAKDPSTTLFDYRQKVKTLSIDVGSLASRVYKGRHLDIPSLVSHCPRLVNLDLYHYKDMPPYREQTENLKWTYPGSLFEALGVVLPEAKAEETAKGVDGDPQEEGSSNNNDSNSNMNMDQDNMALAPLSKAATPSGVRLRSWRWNQRLMGRDMTLEKVRALHLSPTFASLRKISFVNYQRPSLNARDAEDPQVIEEDRQQAIDFAGLLNALPNLTHLSVESSTAANDLILPLLPKTLQHLELINCWDVTADQFAEYLVTHGQALRELTLHYNQSLSLSFLSVLGTACPQLQALRMNLTYYSQHTFYNDSNPNYASLLTPDQVPTWPASIRVIELEHLRKWEPAAAEVFFQSLVDNAPHMPQLRVLAIKAMLDIPWRQRCEMRDRWEAALDRVFTRRSAPPEPARSLSYYAKRRKPEVSPRSKTKARHIDSEPSRRSHRIATQVSNPSSRASSTARLRHKISNSRISYREPDTDEDIPSDYNYDEESEDEKADNAKDHEGSEQDEGQNDDEASDEQAESGGERPSAPKRSRPFVHGMCDVVDIRIDNQKPGEIQYRMTDFLDSDDSNSDDEWTGDGAEANGYAW